jgi:lysophosphatidate acyltransferase
LFAWLAGTTFIDRSRGRHAVDSLVAAAHWASATRTKLLVFPEGTRNHSAGTMLPFKRGAFVAAVAAGLPILPVVFSHYDFLDISGKAPKLERGNVRISVLEPIPTKDLTEADAERLAAETREKMIQELTRGDLQ